MRLPSLSLCALLSAPAAAQVTELVSGAPAGAAANGVSGLLALTPDGRFVAFVSAATNLVPGDTNAATDIFVRDRFTGTTERVSVASGGVQADFESDEPAISADGRFVAFSSNATNLVPGDTNSHWDVFVRDRALGTTERVSVTSAGLQPDWHCYAPSISADGRFVTFLSTADDLVPGDTLGYQDVFLRDRTAGTTVRVNVSSAGAEANQSAIHAAISADGSCVVFDSGATNLVTGDTNGFGDVFVRVLASGTTERASVAGAMTQANHVSEEPSISADGRYVAFSSYATNYVAGDTNGLSDIYVRDRTAQTTTRASLSSGGVQPDMACWKPRLSPDGRSVAFESQSALLVAADTNNANDIFVRDLDLGVTERVSVSGSGGQGDFSSAECALSVGGRFAAFLSAATNLVANDTNALSDVFVHDRRASGFTSLCDPGSAGVLACPCSNPPAGTGRGCENSSASGGARLEASGLAYLAQDTLVFTTAGENPTATTLLVQGDALAPAGVAFGHGVRCAAGALKRLYLKTAAGGAILAPDLALGDPSVSARAAQLGDVLQPGAARWYFAYYRDPLSLGGCSAASAFNTTQTARIDWQP